MLIDFNNSTAAKLSAPPDDNITCPKFMLRQPNERFLINRAIEVRLDPPIAQMRGIYNGATTGVIITRMQLTSEWTRLN